MTRLMANGFQQSRSWAEPPRTCGSRALLSREGGLQGSLLRRDLSRSWPIICAAFAVLALVSCGGAPETGTIDLGPEVDAIFAEFAVEGSPGASAMVIRDGAVVHSAGYGIANLSNGAPLQPSTPVRLGSVTKAFTAMAVVILEESGDLSYDSPVTEWVPELARFDGITVRHLLNHTSGLPDYYDRSPLEEMATAADREIPLQNAEAVSVYEAWGEPVFPPGDRYEYSNPGYEVLALIVERVSSMTFAQFLDTQIFDPLGMFTAAVRDQPSTVIPGRAIGYSPQQETEGWQEDDDHWGNWPGRSGRSVRLTRRPLPVGSSSARVGGNRGSDPGGLCSGQTQRWDRIAIRFRLARLRPTGSRGHPPRRWLGRLQDISCQVPRRGTNGDCPVERFSGCRRAGRLDCCCLSERR